MNVREGVLEDEKEVGDGHQHAQAVHKVRIGLIAFYGPAGENDLHVHWVDEEPELQDELEEQRAIVEVGKEAGERV